MGGRTDLVTALVDDLQDVCGQRVLLPVSDGVGNLASLGGDAVVFSEDSPVSVGHLIQLLLGPVSVVPALLGLLLAHLLQPCPERRGGQRERLSQTKISSLAQEKKTRRRSLTPPAPSPPWSASSPSGHRRNGTALSSAASGRCRQ